MTRDILQSLTADDGRLEELLDALLMHPFTQKKTLVWAHSTMTKTYQSEIASLSRHDKGLHYMTKGITEEKLRSFDIDKISQIMSTSAPCIWELIDGLLTADAELQLKRDTWQRRKMQYKQDSRDADEQVDPEEKYWEFLDEGVPIIDEQDDEPEDLTEGDCVGFPRASNDDAMRDHLHPAVFFFDYTSSKLL
ncbi:hypothetical protein H0H92_012757 [Tricholoma furcatifolium]|nr:hypothetical protein H0H92_012757 [Tricholoma furcatifolium]